MHTNLRQNTTLFRHALSAHGAHTKKWPPTQSSRPGPGVSRSVAKVATSAKPSCAETTHAAGRRNRAPSRRGETPTKSRTARLKTFGELIDLHIDDMCDVGKSPRRSKAAALAMLQRHLGKCNIAALDRERLIRFGRDRAAQGAGPMTLGIDIGFVKLILAHAAAVHGLPVKVEPVDLARIALKRLGLVGKGNQRDRRPTNCRALKASMHEIYGPRRVGRRSMLNGVKSGWDGELSHGWREQRPARSPNSRLPPVRQRRSQACAISFRALRHYRRQSSLGRAQDLSWRSSSKQALP